MNYKTEVQKIYPYAYSFDNWDCWWIFKSTDDSIYADGERIIAASKAKTESCAWMNAWTYLKSKGKL